MLPGQKCVSGIPVVGLFLDPKGFWKSQRTSRICENLAYTKYNALYSAANVPLPSGFFPTYIYFFHTICHVYRSMCPTREAKPRFGAAFEHSAHDCETRLLLQQVRNAKCYLRYPRCCFPCRYSSNWDNTSY